MNRRQLMQLGLGVLGLSALEAVAAEKRAARPSAAGATESFVDPAKEPMAKSVNYVVKKSEVTKADLKVEKQGVKFEQQNCAGCMLYTSAGKKQGAEAGNCTLFPGKLVHGDAWCTSWAKKA